MTTDSKTVLFHETRMHQKQLELSQSPAFHYLETVLHYNNIIILYSYYSIC